jgi:hypothetical protein
MYFNEHFPQITLALQTHFIALWTECARSRLDELIGLHDTDTHKIRQKYVMCGLWRALGVSRGCRNIVVFGRKLCENIDARTSIVGGAKEKHLHKICTKVSIISWNCTFC